MLTIAIIALFISLMSFVVALLSLLNARATRLETHKQASISAANQVQVRRGEAEILVSNYGETMMTRVVVALNSSTLEPSDVDLEPGQSIGWPISAERLDQVPDGVTLTFVDAAGRNWYKDGRAVAVNPD